MLAGLNLGEEAGPSPQLARALANAAAATSMLNLRRLADGYGARAVQMADQEGQSEALALRVERSRAHARPSAVTGGARSRPASRALAGVR